MPDLFTLRLDDHAFRAAVRDLKDSDTRRAASWALNDTAGDVLAHVQERMEVVFDRPTRFTKNAFTIRGARVSRLEASVQERPSVSATHYLKTQEAGGARPRTGLEKLLDARLAYGGQIVSVIPAAGARLNAYGNWSTGQRNQALSAIQAQRDGAANSTSSSPARHRRRAGYFVPRQGSRLSPGIWKRSAQGQLSKVVHFTSMAPVYDHRLGFYDGAEAVARARLPDHLRRTLAKMVAKAAARAARG